MQIAIFSDTHLGFGKGARTGEAEKQARAAMKLALSRKPDAILVPGDLFDKAVPLQETWLEAFSLFSQAAKAPKPPVTLTRTLRDGTQDTPSFSGVPVIAIHGTHEFRGKDYTNALEVLQVAGMVVYVHAGRVEVEKNGEKLAVHALGGVPEKMARDALNAFNPKPMKNAFNLMVLHQSFSEFLPFGEEMTSSLSLSDLPDGFDLVVNGHLHAGALHEQSGPRLLLAGSTVVTQLKAYEAGSPKQVWFLDTKTGNVEGVPIPEQRPFYFEKVTLKKASRTKALEAVRKTVKQALAGRHTGTPRPLVRVKVKGTLAEGLSPSDVDFNSALEGFEGEGLLSVSASIEGASFAKKIEQLRDLQASRKPLSEQGLELLEKHLEKSSFEKAFDVRRVFALLEQGETEKALDLLGPPNKRRSSRALDANPCGQQD